MSDEDWIKVRIEQAKGSCPFVTESVTARLEELLRIRLAEQQLTKTDRESVAKDLLDRMVPETIPGEAQ